MTWINNLLNKVTMYWLVLNVLRALIALAAVLSFFGILPYTWWHILVILTFFLIICYGANYIFGMVFGVKPNYESQFITAEILTLIVGPFNPLTNWLFIVIVAVVAMGTKYVIAVRKRHIFNPAAVGLVVAALVVQQSGSWWIGSVYLLPVVALGGLLINYKTRWLHLVWSFLISYCVFYFAASLGHGMSPADIINSLEQVFINTGLVFFATIMLPEPLTAPMTRNWRIAYGVAVAAILIGLQQYAPSIYYNLELALVIGNFLAFLASPNPKIALRLASKDYFARNSMELVFAPDREFKFKAGQYMQFIMPHAKADSRGSRRYFSIASSPSEKNVMLATKFAEPSSTFKQHLKDLQTNQIILASSVDGDFVLPKNPQTPLVFIAGGIGITPFRSMIKWLVDNNEKRDLVLFYSNKEPDDIGFTDLLDDAEEKIGLKTIYIVSDKVPAKWSGKTGFITPEMIAKEVPNHMSRTYYLSGPDPMVRAYRKMLKEMGLSAFQIKTDYFPGYE